MQKDKPVKDIKDPSITVYFEKNPLYRSIYVDGVIGGITPDGKSLNLNFYATRNTIPKSRLHVLNFDGSLQATGEVSNDSKKGIMSEIEIGTYMSLETAERIYDFLNKALNKDVK